MSQIEAGEPSPHTLKPSGATGKTLLLGTGESTKQQHPEGKQAASVLPPQPPPSFSSQRLVRSFSEANVNELKEILNRTDTDYDAYAPTGSGGPSDDVRGTERGRLHPVAESLFFALAECADIQVPRYLTEVVSFFCEHLRDDVERDVFTEVDNITLALKDSCRGNPTNWLKSCAQSLVLLGNIMQTVAGVDEEGGDEGDEEDDVTDDDNEDGEETTTQEESSTAEVDDKVHRQEVTVDEGKQQ